VKENMSFWLLVDVVSKTKPRALQGKEKQVILAAR